MPAARAAAPRPTEPRRPSRARRRPDTALPSIAPLPEPLSAPRPRPVPRRDFSPQAYGAAQPLCLTQASLSPHIPQAPADNLVRSEQDLVVKLGRMPIELAAPMLAADMPALDTPALLALIRATGDAHHAVIARRKALDWRVVKALIHTGAEITLLTLAENRDAQFDADDRVALSRYAETMIMVRGALLSRPGFTFVPSGQKLNADDGLGFSNLRLLKLIRAGRHGIFIREAARRLHLTAATLAEALSTSSDVSLALVLRALGMDRAVFVHLLPRWRAAHGRPERDTSHLVLSIFTLSRDEALRKLSAGLA